MKGEPKVVSHSAVENRARETDASLRPNSDAENDGFKARRFALVDLVAATENFKDEYFLGEGGFGKVYKGRLQDTGEVSWNYIMHRAFVTCLTLFSSDSNASFVGKICSR